MRTILRRVRIFVVFRALPALAAALFAVLQPFVFVAALPWRARAAWRRIRHMPCSNPECRGRSWWRVFLILRDEDGRDLARMPTPFRVCGACFRDLDPTTATPDRPIRRSIAKALQERHGRRPAWNRTALDREHVFAAWLRRIGS